MIRPTRVLGRVVRIGPDSGRGSTGVGVWSLGSGGISEAASMKSTKLKLW